MKSLIAHIDILGNEIDDRNAKIAEYESQEDEWSILMSKKSNTLQHYAIDNANQAKRIVELEEELKGTSKNNQKLIRANEQIRELQADLLKQSDYVDGLTADIAELKRKAKPVTHIAPRYHHEDTRRDNTPKDAPKPPDPDVLLFHDSLGKRINNTILSRENVVTI